MKKISPVNQNLRLFLRSVFLSSVAVALVFSLASAVSGGDHACDYLSKDEVTTVLGLEAADGEAQAANPMGQSICFFDIPADMAVRFAQLQMVRTDWAVRAGTGWSASSLFENNMGFLDTLRKVEDLGEKAYWGGSGMKLGAGLHVLYKDTYFTVLVEMGDEENNLRKSQNLVKVVLKKLE
ncbi:MAG: hypothetical protein V2I36_15105 [Desulfopila sp.]|nr:hypothetical protein [Desulfopila sp.]